MDKIIDKLYDLHLNTEPFPFGVGTKENSIEEWQLYNFLYKNLSPEHKRAFLRYVELYGNRESEEVMLAYKLGFKTAIKLFVESLKEA